MGKQNCSLDNLGCRISHSMVVPSLGLAIVHSRGSDSSSLPGSFGCTDIPSDGKTTIPEQEVTRG